MNNEMDIQAAKKYALDLLSQREYTQAGLKRKLEQKGADPSVSEQCIADLQALGYVSDERYAELFVRQRARNGYGPRRIQQELQQKGVSSVLVKAALECFDGDWFENALSVRVKRFPKIATDLKGSQKQKRFLQYRGFDFSHIDHAMTSYGAESEDIDY